MKVGSGQRMDRLRDGTESCALAGRRVGGGREREDELVRRRWAPSSIPDDRLSKPEASPDFQSVPYVCRGMYVSPEGT